MMAMKEYTREGLTVQWNPEKCIHAQECIKGLPGVFNRDSKPWIDMRGASLEEIMRVIDRCPSGALSYKQRKPPLEEEGPQPGEGDVSDGTYASIKVVKSGPLLVEGKCRLLNSSGDEVAREGVYALCRCGASRKKPFCDGSHINADFDDAERGRG
ncbi:MAG: (4Fe-4S)-binding protein [Methanothrix sp.]|jgi:uncharacterized Fe-S cluster protein YjdI/CDGSH-type Zn-finger protein|uniref:(4Fe-4S)-binding protein n=1 Tax=Methanothrix sp. TaxID=90426 RepID=UPI0025E75D23|nr:(4Fe-4S)-binding protein [Methanothrix sp.]HPW73889.1 (4Fe-4S)-binding protein [Methanothrix sp.]